MQFTRSSISSAIISLPLLLLVFASGCRNISRQIIAPETKSTGSNSNHASAPIFSMPADSLHMAYTGIAIRPLRTYYAARQGRLFWTSDTGCTGAADSVIAFIEEIRYYGLLPADYHITEIQQLKRELNPADNRYRLEALLTDAYITMSRHVQAGKAARASHSSDSAGVALLENASRRGGVIKSITTTEPAFRGYKLLKQGLKQFLDSLPTDQRKAVLSNSSVGTDLVTKTMQAIEVNLERWRWEKPISGNRYIIINIPAFMLYVVEGDSVVFESKVIVGKPDTPTPELSSKIECFVTYPYWHVPRKIAVEEYLPVLKKDRSFLAANNFEVLDRQGNKLDPDSVPWNKFTTGYFPVVLRQREGPENSLGIIKFNFDNPFAVFLHDTNAKRLFRHQERAFSHGCIRMEKAVELAHYLVTGQHGSQSAVVSKYLREKRRHSIDIREPILIYTRYFTCGFDHNRLQTYKDIYLKDKAVYGLLYGGINNPDL